VSLLRQKVLYTVPSGWLVGVKWRVVGRNWHYVWFPGNGAYEGTPIPLRPGDPDEVTVVVQAPSGDEAVTLLAALRGDLEVAKAEDGAVVMTPATFLDLLFQAGYGGKQ